jgi:NitT/TauT family transport system ATP-binding protein
LQDDLLQMCSLRRTTVMFVTHDIAEAVYLGDRVAVMENGRVVQDVRIDLDQPRSAAIRYGADFNSRCAEVRAAMDLVAA